MTSEHETSEETVKDILKQQIRGKKYPEILKVSQNFSKRLLKSYGKKEQDTPDQRVRARFRKWDQCSCVVDPAQNNRRQWK